MTRNSVVKPRTSKSKGAHAISKQVDDLKLAKMRLEIQILDLEIKQLQRRRKQKIDEDSDASNIDSEMDECSDDKHKNILAARTSSETDTSDDSDMSASDTDDDSDMSASDTDDDSDMSASDTQKHVLAAGAGSETDNSDDSEYAPETDDDVDEPQPTRRMSSRKRKTVKPFIEEQTAYFHGKFHGSNDRWDNSYNGHFSCSECGQLYDRKETRECDCEVIHWRYGPDDRELAEERLDDRTHKNSSRSKSFGYIKDDFVV